MAASETIREAFWQRSFLKEIGFEEEGPIVVGSDSESAIKLASDPVYHERTKHIDIRVHVIREHIRKGTATLIYVPTNVQVADSLTKAVPRAKVQFCCTRMGLVDLESTVGV